MGRYRRKKWGTAARWGLVALGVALLGLLVFHLRLRPVLTSYALNDAKVLGVRALNASVIDALAACPIAATDLVVMEKDDSGRVTALRANAQEMNRFKAKLIETAGARLEGLQNDRIEIPLGSVTGPSFFTGRGPRFKAAVRPYGNVDARMTSTFTSAGINQTRMRVEVELTAQVSVVIASGVATATVKNESVVAETILVGEVPQTYVDLETGPH